MTLKIRIRDFVCECLCLIPFDYLDKLRLYQFKRGIFASIAVPILIAVFGWLIQTGIQT